MSQLENQNILEEAAELIDLVSDRIEGYIKANDLEGLAAYVKGLEIVANLLEEK